MKYWLIYAAAFLLLASPCWADELLLKDGKRVEWVALRDQGETCEVETPQGTRLTFKKSEIDKVLLKGSEALTGAIYTKLTGKVKSQNCFALIDPKKDLFGAAGIEAKFKGPSLICDLKCDSPTRLQIPTKIGEEYDFVVTIERKDGVCDFYIGLVGGGKPFLVRFDAEFGIKTGIPGWKMTDTGGQLLKKDMPATISCFVRKDSLIVMLDKKEIINWKGDSWDFKLPEGYALPEGKVFLFVGSQKLGGTTTNLWSIGKMTLSAKE